MHQRSKAVSSSAFVSRATLVVCWWSSTLTSCHGWRSKSCPEGTAPSLTRDDTECLPDSDGDGVTDEVDCAPADSTASYGDTADAERCNYLDDDCDGEVDEGCPMDSADSGDG